MHAEVIASKCVTFLRYNVDLSQHAIQFIKLYV